MQEGGTTQLLTKTLLTKTLLTKTLLTTTTSTSEGREGMPFLDADEHSIIDDHDLIDSRSSNRAATDGGGQGGNSNVWNEQVKKNKSRRTRRRARNHHHQFLPEHRRQWKHGMPWFWSSKRSIVKFLPLIERGEKTVNLEVLILYGSSVRYDADALIAEYYEVLAFHNCNRDKGVHSII
jgi:hypothetical protein